jgi:hypothetical protein
MKVVLILACTVLAFCCLGPEAAGLPHQTNKPTTNREIWVLQQFHSDAGPEDVYIANDAIKIVNKRSGYELLCKAPKWEVHGFRSSTKLEWIAPLSLFDGLLIHNPNAAPSMSKEIYRPKSKGKTLGLNFTHFMPKALSLSSIDGTADIATAPEVLEFICRLYRCPDTHTVPLLIRSHHGKRTLPKFQMASINTGMGNDLRCGLIEELSTKSWKKIPYKADIFALPVKFKRTMSLPQVTFSADMKEQFDEIFRDGTGFRGELH